MDDTTLVEEQFVRCVAGPLFGGILYGLEKRANGALTKFNQDKCKALGRNNPQAAGQAREA